MLKLLTKTQLALAVLLTSSLFLTACTVTGLVGGVTGS